MKWQIPPVSDKTFLFPSLTDFTQYDKSLGPSMLQPMVNFRSFWWLSVFQCTEDTVCLIFLHFSMDGHFGWCCVFVIVNRAALKRGMHVSYKINLPSGSKARSGLARSCANSIVNALWNLHTVLLHGCRPPIYVPAHSVGGFPVPLAFSNI